EDGIRDLTVTGVQTCALPISEAGLLGGEAAINSTAVAYAFKSAIERPRPSMGLQQGTSVFRGASFPSEHAAIAWSVASVWAHERSEERRVGKEGRCRGGRDT